MSSTINVFFKGKSLMCFRLLTETIFVTERLIMVRRIVRVLIDVGDRGRGVDIYMKGFQEAVRGRGSALSGVAEL